MALFKGKKRKTSSELKRDKMTHETFPQKLSVSYPSLENLGPFLLTKPLSGSQASAVVGFNSLVSFSSLNENSDFGGEEGWKGGGGGWIQSKGVWETYSKWDPQVLIEGPNPTVCYIDEN